MVFDDCVGRRAWVEVTCRSHSRPIIGATATNLHRIAPFLLWTFLKSFDGALFRAFLCLEKKWINGSPEAIHKRINSWVSSLIANSKIRSLRSKFPLKQNRET
ncbi:hypothetical protein Naga_100010g86 [Nannochloropsis gaditana]|uniref:Uncharacterized protein n=1 Tax=Nannochloropsis gaditana TaxID=72520 RepID=W7U2X9_9STRA|nr:hypothetical protein Naga_100010g86 [Nannochloropsis gaditana]